MGRSLLTFWLVVMMMVVEMSSDEGVNKSASGGLLSSTADGDGHLVRNAEIDESLNEHDELDGGFPSLDGMLQWAIGHSDPAKLESKAHDVQQLSTDELEKRQVEIKELVEKLEMPSDAKLMQIAIDDLNNSSLSLEDHRRALEELLILVEPIDNANDLHKIGGLAVVIGKLGHSDPMIRTSCAWIIGIASQNNPVVQKQVVELGALAKLMMMVKSCFIEEAVKALYAVSAIIRNNPNGLELFYLEGGDLLVQGILSNATADVRLRRRSVSLVGDVAEYQLQHITKAEPPFLSSCAFLRPLIDMTTLDDLDLQEKALVAIKSLLMLRSSEVVVAEGFCGLKGALETIHLDGEYAIDVEALRKEVESIYLEKVSLVPT